STSPGARRDPRRSSTGSSSSRRRSRRSPSTPGRCGPGTPEDGPRAPARCAAACSAARRRGSDVPEERLDAAPGEWRTTIEDARARGYAYFDWLSAVDETDRDAEPGLDVL